jgi:hypothetical protein
VAASSIHIPAVMVAEPDEKLIDRALRSHHHSPVVARMVSASVACDAPPRRKAAVEQHREGGTGDADPLAHRGTCSTAHRDVPRGSCRGRSLLFTVHCSLDVSVSRGCVARLCRVLVTVSASVRVWRSQAPKTPPQRPSAAPTSPRRCRS